MSDLNPNLPFYGATREQIVAQGLDPDLVEQGRLASREIAVEQRLAEETRIALAAQEAVESGRMTYAEAAEEMRAAGHHNAHAAFVQRWREDEAWYKEQQETEAISFLDADAYAAHVAEQEQRKLRALEQDAEVKRAQLRVAQVKEMQEALKAFKESTPGAHQLSSAVERQLVADLERTVREGGDLPTTSMDRQAALERAVKETTIIGNETESIRQQVDAEWRILRKQNGARDGLHTAADIARAEEAYKSARFQQLADTRMIDETSFEPSPTAEQESQALVDRYRERQEKSTGFHSQIADIATRGKQAASALDRGEGISEEKKRYREALARAESEAHYGTVTTSLTQPPEQRAEKDPQQLDEYGGAFPGYSAS